MEDSKKIRFLDKYAGSSICFAFTLINKMRPRRKVDNIRNILIIELFEMGAAIMAYSSLRYIKENLDDPNIYVITLDRVKPSWDILDIIPEENFFSIKGKNLFTFITSLLRQVWALRKRRIDLIIDFELFMRIPAIISFLIKSRLRAGFNRYLIEGLYRGGFYDINCAFNQNVHISKNFLALTKSAIHQEKNIPNHKGTIKNSEIKIPKYRSNARLKKSIIEKIKKIYTLDKNDIYVVSPDVGKVLAVRNYPKDYLVEVIRKLLKYNKRAIAVLIGIDENMPICNYIEKHVNDERCINFCSQTESIFELMELLSLSKLVITNDNGHAHFAAMAETKTIALFSTDSPFMYGPLGKCVILYSHFHCSPCINAFNHKSSVCNNNLCLQSIKPDTVVRYSIDLLNGKLKYKTINNEIPYI
jgi:ADP-heptose:LPS heptosyltransferase